MRWPWRRNGAPVDPKGKELAKSQLEVAKVIEAESFVIAAESTFLLYSNHFGPNTAKALKEGPKK